MAHTYNVDTGAWVQDPQEGWVSSKVVEKKINGSKVLLVFELTGGSRAGEVSSPAVFSFACVHLRHSCCNLI